MSVNIRSISSIDKFLKFKTLIAHLEILPDVIAVQETWFKSNIQQIYNIPGYRVIHCCRHDGYGGTSLYIRSTFNFVVDSCESKQFIEAIQISLQNFKINGKPLKICTFYRSQKCDTNAFYSFIDNILSTNTHMPTVIVGDANIDLLNEDLSADISNTLLHYDFKNCHTMVTRPNSNKSIDHIYSNVPSCLLIDSIECDITDHNLIFCKMKKRIERSKYSEMSYKKCDYNLLYEKLQNQLSLFNNTGNSSNDMSHLINMISNCVKETTVEKVRKTKLKYQIAPWINENLHSLMVLRDKLLERRRKNDKNPVIKNKLKRLSRIIKIACKTCRNNYYQSSLNKLHHDPKKCWNFLNETLGRNVKQKLQLKNDNGEFIMDDKHKCDVLNKYFLEIPEVLNRGIRVVPSDSFNHLLTLRQCNSQFKFEHTSNEELLNIILNLQMNKSPGYDGITSNVLIKCGSIITSFLVNIFNNIINSATYPTALKTSRITPIPKEAMASTVDKFRPIALLPTIDKVFEKVLHRQLSEFLEQNNLLYNLQFGFKKGCGTQEAVVYVVNYICENLDNGYGGVGAIFYDFSKAFDLVDHEVLLKKLPYYGLQNNAVKLLESYLYNRTQYVEINGVRSDMGNVKYGVPQGSVLGPLLFLIFLNDISNLNLYGKLVMYADDLCLFYPYNHDLILKSQMEHDANILLEYVRMNKLSLNKDKTKVIRFRPYCSNSALVFNVSVGNVEIYECDSLKYLGIHFQSNLSWNKHVQTLKSKIAPVIGILHKFKYLFDGKTKLQIYYALIHSHLNYLPMIYASKRTADIKTLQRAQNKALKIVFNVPRLHSTLSLYKEICKTILPINGLYKMQLLVYMFKAVHNIGFHAIEFTINQNNYNTRNNSNLHVKRCRLETTKQRVEYIGCSEFNRLPLYLKNIQRVCMFKTALKHYLLEEIEMLLHM